jgi:DNA-binding response OmpR family regulator
VNTCRRNLVVAVCPSLADRVARLLEQLGHQVRIARDGEAALVVAQNFFPEVVVFDLTVRDAYELPLALRNAVDEDRTLLIAMSASQEQETVTRAAAFDGWIAGCVNDESGLKRLLALLSFHGLP